jgi:glycosyltransferase involved in cell wall biosynthesis/SAM-dependent methyltransferase
MASPLVSGIVAAYNYERYLEEALESALDQDYPADRLELIVVDDGSTDGTSEIARRYAEHYPERIRYVRQRNAGLAAATTRGFEEARGDLITLLDADDAWLPSRTRLLVDALARNPRASLVYGDTRVIDEEGRMIAPSWLQEQSQLPFRGRVASHLLRSNFVMAPSLMVRGELVRERICPIPSFFPAQDWFIAARVAEVAEIDFVPAVVALYRRHGNNMSHGMHGPAEVAALWRRDIGMRRWMLANLRADELSVEDLADGFSYLMKTLSFVASVQGEAIESLLSVSEADRERAASELGAGRTALAGAEFVAAAGHFVAALAADPFDTEAQHGLDGAQRRLVVPPPRRATIPSARDLKLTARYTCREETSYGLDLLEERDGITGQPDVYERAAAVGTRLGATRVIDLGCGAGAKLVALSPRFEIVGIDHGPNLELVRRRFPDWAWREHDLDGPGPLPLGPEELEDSVVVCANVVEQLFHPELLLENLHRLLDSVQAVVVSTPDRDLTRGDQHLGPPPDLSRVREWNIQEFAQLLEAFRFEHGDLGLTRSDDRSGLHHTILAILYPDAERAARAQAAGSPAAVPS